MEDSRDGATRGLKSAITLLTHLSGLASNLITDVTKPLSYKRYFVAQKSCDDIYHRVSLGGDLCSYVMYKT